MIKDQQEHFANVLYHQLVRDLPAINSYLQFIGPCSFSMNLIQSLETAIREIRSYGEVITPIHNFWLEPATPVMATLQPTEVIRVAETFLGHVSELAEETWNPALENAWRKAIKTALSDLWGPETDSYLTLESKPLFFARVEGRTMTQHLLLYLLPLMIVAGGIAALGLWSRNLSEKARVQAREPWDFSTCA